MACRTGSQVRPAGSPPSPLCTGEGWAAGDPLGLVFTAALGQPRSRLEQWKEGRRAAKLWTPSPLRWWEGLWDKGDTLLMPCVDTHAQGSSFLRK